MHALTITMRVIPARFIIMFVGRANHRNDRNDPSASLYPAQVKSSSNTPVMQRTRRAQKERGLHAPHNISLASCPSGRRSGWAVRRFDSLVLNEVPDVALGLCAQGEGAFLRIAPQRYKSKEPPC